ncbi:hypothetical protein [Rubritalea marina]|uniref:hypothetical protein n=1 Tax=Rubritalea marina TaxID=361055 RepID=UPI0003771C1C|nr:hypothetical protein [Rubritalea marina]
MGNRTIALHIITFLLLSSHSSVFASNEKSKLSSAKDEINQIDNFINERASVFAINNRAYDPFGQPQDPHKAVVVKKQVKKQAAAPKVEEKILIKQEINKLGKKITVLGNMIIVDGAPYKRGNKINVSVKGKQFPLKVNSISRSRITFLDLSDKSIVTLKLQNGTFFTPGSDDLPALPSGENKTINLDK